MNNIAYSVGRATNLGVVPRRHTSTVLRCPAPHRYPNTGKAVHHYRASNVAIWACVVCIRVSGPRGAWRTRPTTHKTHLRNSRTLQGALAQSMPLSQKAIVWLVQLFLRGAPVPLLRLCILLGRGNPTIFDELEDCRAKHHVVGSVRGPPAHAGPPSRPH